MESILIFIEGIILNHGALGLFIASLLEEIIAPIPSSLVIMMGSFFLLGEDPISLVSFLKLFMNVVLPVSLGLTIGSLFTYSIFYFLGKPALNVLGKYLGVSFSDIEKVRDKLSRGISDEVFIFLTRATPFFPIVVINIFFGLSRYPVFKFVTISFFGVLIRATIMGFVGWQMGVFYKEIALKFEGLEKFFAAIFVVFLVYLFYKNRSKNEPNGNVQPK